MDFWMFLFHVKRNSKGKLFHVKHRQIFAIFYLWCFMWNNFFLMAILGRFASFGSSWLHSAEFGSLFYRFGRSDWAVWRFERSVFVVCWLVWRVVYVVGRFRWQIGERARTERLNLLNIGGSKEQERLWQINRKSILRFLLF